MRKYTIDKKDGTEGERDGQWVVCQGCGASALARCVKKERVKPKGCVAFFQKTYQLPDGWAGQLESPSCPQCLETYNNVKKYQAQCARLAKRRLSLMKESARCHAYRA